MTLWKRMKAAVVGSLTAAGFTMGTQSEPSKVKVGRDLLLKISNAFNTFIADGSQWVRMIIDFRVTFIGGTGAEITAKSAANKTFLERFVKLNKITSIGFRNWSEDAEVEGRELLKLRPKEDDKGEMNIKVRALSWLQHDYTVHSEEDDPDDYQEITIEQGAGKKPIRLKPEETVYVRIGGQARFVNAPMPIIASIMPDIAALVDAYADWRKVNRKYGIMQPYFEALEESAASDILAAVTKTDWSPGKALAARAKAYYLAPPAGATESVQSEINDRHETVAGVSGVPIHYMQKVRLFGNKAGAEELTGVLNSRTSTERLVWKEKLTELCRKAILMYNKATMSALDPDDVIVTIPEGSIEQFKNLMAVWMPAREKKQISQRTLHDQFPGVDPKEEKRRLEQEKKSQPVPPPVAPMQPGEDIRPANGQPAPETGNAEEEQSQAQRQPAQA